MKPPPSLHPAGDVLLRAEQVGASLAGLAPRVHCSLPFPLPGAEGLLWAVCLSSSEEAADTSGPPAPGAVRVGVPAYLATFRADYGVFAELRPLAEQELGVGAPSTPAHPWLGEILDAPVRRGRHARLFELYEAAVPGFAAGPKALTPAVRKAAEELRAWFPEAAEPPLLPCYRALGARFFAWLDQFTTASPARSP